MPLASYLYVLVNQYPRYLNSIIALKADNPMIFFRQRPTSEGRHVHPSRYVLCLSRRAFGPTFGVYFEVHTGRGAFSCILTVSALLAVTSFANAFFVSFRLHSSLVKEKR